MIVVCPPGDKSISHRAVLIAPLAGSESVFTGVSDGADVQSSLSVMKRLGAEIHTESHVRGGLRVTVSGNGELASPSGRLDCGNSGTTARLLTGLVAGSGIGAVLDGDESLRRRPMRRIVYPLQAMGARIDYIQDVERLPLRIHARATGALRTLRHRARIASAQVKSAVLLAGLTGRVRVELTEPAASRDHTERLLSAMGAPVSYDSEREGPGDVTLDPTSWDGDLQGLDMTVPGDPSSAAFLLGAALLARTAVRIDGVSGNPTRVGFLEVLAEMGAGIERERRSDAVEPIETWTVRPPDRLTPFRVGGDRIPGLIDELPLLAVLASRADGRSEIRDASELRVKESDRIASVAGNLEKLGVDVSERPDGLDIVGRTGPMNGRVTTHGDHRLAMAFGVLDAAGDTDLQIDDPTCVEISFPDFWSALEPFAIDRRSGRPAAAASSGRVISIDGPAASGKSSTAQAVAERLGWVHVNSGLFYRALTWWTLEQELDDQAEDFASAINDLAIGLVESAKGLTVAVEGTAPGQALHSSAVAARVSAVSSVPAVRELVLERLRDAGGRYDLVCDGRDIGTTVFSDAALKVYLVAEPGERARRRLLERGGPELTPETIAEETERLQARDDADASRVHSPLRAASDAIEIDTTRMTPDEVVQAIVELAVERGLA